MNSDYSLSAAFAAARKNSQDTLSLTSTDKADQGDQNNQKSITYPIMDLNDITRDYERYKQKLWEERMLNLHEMLRS